MRPAVEPDRDELVYYLNMNNQTGVISPSMKADNKHTYDSAAHALVHETKQALETAKGLQNYSSTKQIPEAGKLDKQSEYALNKYLQENKNSNKNSHVNSQVYVDVLNDGEKQRHKELNSQSSHGALFHQSDMFSSIHTFLEKQNIKTSIDHDFRYGHQPAHDMR